MCTIIVRHQIDEWCSTVIASNRDEFYQRKATPPTVLSSDPIVIGGRDESKGGTWFGVTVGGLHAGLTNQRTFGLPDDVLRSRGELVLHALETGSHAGIRSYLEAIDPQRYNDFNLIYGDGVSLEAAYGRRASTKVEFETLGKGVHVLCNGRLGSPEFPKARMAASRVRSIVPQPWEGLMRELATVLSDGSLPDAADVPAVPDNALFDQDLARHLQAICVKTPIYGTVSSTVAAIRPGEALQYHYSGEPGATDGFEDFTDLVRP
ncbi:MAG: NRDE family protein [Polyangiales bacterium]